MTLTATPTTADRFEQDVLLSDVPVLVDFWAEWCGPCRMVAPVLDAIQAEHPTAIRILKLNVDENPELADEYEITSIPAMKVFEAGKVSKTIVGALPKYKLEVELAEYLRPADSAHSENTER